MSNNESASNYQGEKIVVIGGGTGNFTTLTGLKPLIREGLTAIVSMADDGGSTGYIRDKHGVLPAGDARQCLVALSNVSESARELFNVRFSEEDGFGDSPHNFGNMLLLAAEKSSGSFSGAIELASNFLNITGRVVPVTHDNRRLVVTSMDGEVIKGEHNVEMREIPSLEGSKVEFDADISTEAEAAIKESSLTVIAPGDLYTSIGPTLAVRGMKEALKAARVVQVTNIMNRNRHTVGFDVSTHAKEVERIVGAPVLDYVLYNTKSPSEEARLHYMKEGEVLVPANETLLSQASYKSIGKNLISEDTITIAENDVLADARSLIRHDSKKLSRAIMAILYGNGD